MIPMESGTVDEVMDLKGWMDGLELLNRAGLPSRIERRFEVDI